MVTPVLQGMGDVHVAEEAFNPNLFLLAQTDIHPT